MPDSGSLSDKLAALRRERAEKAAAEGAGPPPPPEPTPPPQVEPERPEWTGEQPRSIRSTRAERKSPTGKPKDAHADPPHSVEAEQGILGSILMDCQQTGAFAVLAEVAARINEHYFYVPAHGTIYRTFVSLWRSGVPIGLITFTQHLRDHGTLDSVGGAQFVTGLYTFVPTAAAVEYYLDIVVEKFARREIIADATKLVRAAYGQTDDEGFPALVQRVSGRLVTISSVNGKFPQLQDTKEFFTTEDPPLPKQVIYRLLHQGSKMLLGGNSKGRKSYALMDLAVSVATDTDWWGWHTRKGGVCYINLEIQPEFFRQRLKKIAEVKQVEPEAGMFWVWNLRGHAKPMAVLVNELLVFLRGHRFILIIIDPVYKTLPAYGGSENDSAAITALLNEVERIAVETGAAVLFSSHFSKGEQAEKQAVDRVSGSGAWARDPDTILTMTPHEEQDCFTVEATLRNYAPISPFVVRWDWPLFVRETEMDPEKLRLAKNKGRPLNYTANDILAEMKIAEGMKTTALQKHMGQEFGMSKASFYRLWDEIRKSGRIRIDDEGLWFKTAKAEQAQMPIEVPAEPTSETDETNYETPF